MFDKKYFCQACFNIETFGYNPNAYQHTHIYIAERVNVNKKSLSLQDDNRNRDNNLQQTSLKR